MFENIAAIDVGTSSIKVITIRTGLKDFQVKSFAYENIDFEIENSDDAVMDALERIVTEEKLNGYKVITNLPMERAIIRNITFPFNDVEKIAEAIPYEAEENIPFSLDDLILDFQSLKSENRDEGKILLAAAHKERLYDFLKQLDGYEIKPVIMGMESNSLFECYRYFNKIEDEAIIQLDIGNNKTIINIIKNNNLLYTRSISIGVNLIHQVVSDIVKSTSSEVIRLFNNLNLDLTSFENNLQRGYYKSLGLTKQKFKKIFTASVEVIEELIEQILLTIKAFLINNEQNKFNRMLISGGGSNISGLGTLLSKELDIPVVSLPFLDDYKEKKIQTQFPIVFGTVLSYLNKKKGFINFLKGEFTPEIVGTSKKIYYLSAGFIILSIIVLIVNFLSSSIFTSSSNKQYNEILNKNFKKYFNISKVGNDPISDAKKIIKKEEKDLKGMSLFVSENNSILELLKDILINFPDDDNFELKNIIINEKIVRIDGTVGTSKNIDDFKLKLQQSNKFESVSLNIKYSRRNEVRFSMTIKQIIPGEKNKVRGK